MPNFFTDNEDIKFHLKNADLKRIVALQENDFSEAGDFDYAPENLEDALDSYEKALAVTGEIAGNLIAPKSPQIDEEGNRLEDGCVTYARGIRESLDALSKADLMGFTLPRKFGGLNFPNCIYTMAVEIVSRADASLMNIFGLQGIAETINAFASEEIKEKYLPGFSSGEYTGAMALTEPDAGSDLQNVQLRAEEVDGKWKLSGVKRFITNGCGEILLVLARSEEDQSGGMGLSLFLVERGEGVRVRHIENKLGIHGSPTCELQLNEAPGLLVGLRKRGLISYVLPLMNGARIGIAAQSLGIGEAAYRVARNYANSRQQFGRPIEQFPAVAEMLVDMRIMLEAARCITYEGSQAMDLDNLMLKRLETGDRSDEGFQTLRKEQRKYKKLAAFLTPCAKYYSSEMSVKVTSDAIQVLGGSGYMKDYPLEQLYRDARITTIYEGTSQLQVVAAVRGVLSGVAESAFEELAAEGFEGALGELAGKLAENRELTAKAVEFLKKQSSDYLDLYSRKLVDMAIDIYIGYLFLKQAKKSEHKEAVARKFINDASTRGKANFDLITSGRKEVLTDYQNIVGPPYTEED